MNVFLLNIETMEWPVYEGEMHLRYPETCFPNPLINPPEPYVWVQDVDMPSYNWLTQGISEEIPHQTDGVWYRTWVIYDLDASQIAVNENAARQQNKNTATSLLSSTDWTATIDVSDPQYRNPYLANQSEFLSYRSQLSNIALNPPVTVDVWPEKPNEHWVEVK